MTQDVYIRNVIVTIWKSLNNVIQLNYVKNNQYEHKKIPFYFEMSGDERFLQDLFFGETNDLVEKMSISGNFEKIPRGIFSLGAPVLDTSQYSSKYIPGRKIEISLDGVVSEYFSNVNILPVSIPIDCEIKVSTTLDLYKTWETIIKTLHNMTAVEFTYDNFPIKGQLVLSTDTNLDKTTEFSFGDLIEKKITFSLELKTYFPIFNTTKGFVFDENNRIKNFEINIDPDIKPLIITSNEEKEKGSFEFGDTLSEEELFRRRIIEEKMKKDVENNLDHNVHHQEHFGKETVKLDHSLILKVFKQSII